ncbi:hypothetical protein HOU39_gp132 [Lactobacillus phage Iacchus]|uniref:Uncharacterized protein n=1 Tax=Lactobacillus phage Iacchus TaxID=2315483 RepID=A0A3Q8HXI8_9CAUD|nr:hypothetical protein HOU39_gp132 [Lactobacillus phage Iacchus]AYH92026.1 hypothetical protein [Lactobacillus phage Iacchus]AYH92198.1 hypothetical protein [Lactobacillus phage Dionysus]
MQPSYLGKVRRISMKTEEFIKIVTKTPGYIVKVGECETRVSGEIGGDTVAAISEEYQNMVDLHYMSGVSDDLFDAIVAYAKTPISERKGVIRKRVKVVSTDENSYLHVDVFSWGQRAYLGRLVDEDLTSVIDDFSPEQIEQLKSRDDVAIDWNKVALEDVD